MGALLWCEDGVVAVVRSVIHYPRARRSCLSEGGLSVNRGGGVGVWGRCIVTGHWTLEIGRSTFYVQHLVLGVGH